MKTNKVEMRGILPRYPEDQDGFILQKLEEVEPCSIADLVRHLGGEHRQKSGGPSLEYERVKSLLKRMERDGKVSSGRGRGDWRVASDD